MEELIIRIRLQPVDEMHINTGRPISVDRKKLIAGRRQARRRLVSQFRMILSEAIRESGDAVTMDAWLQHVEKCPCPRCR